MCCYCHTCTVSSHDRGENTVIPLIGNKIIFPIKLSNRQTLGVDGIVLMESNEVEENKQKEEEEENKQKEEKEEEEEEEEENGRRRM